jgi:DNA-binding response OmpR family regulator
VVDDYAFIADQLAKVIWDKGCKALAVYSGIEALRAGKQFSPHALIADVMMPGMNGAELVCAFSERFAACRAVLMTANQWAPEIFVGGSRIKVLQKPFEIEEIFGFLASAIREAQESVLRLFLAYRPEWHSILSWLANELLLNMHTHAVV